MCVTMSPISSTWPTTATVGPPPVPGTRASEVPMTSTLVSAKAPASRRNTAAGAVS